MRITELFTAQSIALDEAAADQAQIIDRLVELQATHGNITDREAYKKALYAREAEASTYVDNGITVPHARTDCVTRPSLAAMRLAAPVQYYHRCPGRRPVRRGELHPAGDPPAGLPRAGCDRLPQRHRTHLHGRRGADQGR